ncbi:MAG: PEP-CTERM sorting domain-containing protein [Burkholderiales bacterium]|nr:PEP-CTERM sorting domain-containing protein [Opitutaceae bacterium]
MFTSLNKTLLVGTLLATASAATAQTVLLNDTFTSATRNGTAPSVSGVDRDGVGTTNDYVVATNGNAAQATGVTNDYASNVGTGINGNSFFVINPAGAYSVSTYFTSTALAAGESISVSFNIRSTLANPGAGTGAFRVGLFNSGGTRLANNQSAFGGSGAFTDDVGYIANYSTNAAAVNQIVQERTTAVATNNIFQGTFGQVGTAVSTANTLAFDTIYAATLTLARSGDGSTMSISSTFNGINLNVNDAVTPYTTFDHLSIFFGSQFGNATTPRTNYIDDVTVTFTPIPEPSSYATLAGLGVIGLVALRRRRSAT